MPERAEGVLVCLLSSRTRRPEQQRRASVHTAEPRLGTTRAWVPGVGVSGTRTHGGCQAEWQWVVQGHRLLRGTAKIPLQVCGSPTQLSLLPCASASELWEEAEQAGPLTRFWNLPPIRRRWRCSWNLSAWSRS